MFNISPISGLVWVIAKVIFNDVFLINQIEQKSNPDYSLRKDCLRNVGLLKIGSIGLELVQLVDDLGLGVVVADLHDVVAEQVLEQVVGQLSQFL